MFSIGYTVFRPKLSTLSNRLYTLSAFVLPLLKAFHSARGEAALLGPLGVVLHHLQRSMAENSCYFVRRTAGLLNAVLKSRQPARSLQSV